MVAVVLEMVTISNVPAKLGDSKSSYGMEAHSPVVDCHTLLLIIRKAYFDLITKNTGYGDTLLIYIKRRIIYDHLSLN